MRDESTFIPLKCAQDNESAPLSGLSRFDFFAESNCQRSYLFCILRFDAPFKSSPSEPSFVLVLPRNTILLYYLLYGGPPADCSFRTLSSTFIQVQYLSRCGEAAETAEQCESTITLAGNIVSTL